MARRETLISNAQFWAEDGAVFYAQAYNIGPRSIFEPYNGYLHLAPRLIALASQAVPTIWAPYVFSVVVCSVPPLVAVVLLSSSAASMGNLRVRLAWAVLLIVCPNGFETYGNLSNLQWLIAIGMAILLARPAPKPGISQAVLLAASFIVALTGPFAPLYLWFTWVSREPAGSAYRRKILGIFALGSLVQIVTFFSYPRYAIQLGATSLKFFQIIGMRATLWSLIGQRYGIQQLKDGPMGLGAALVATLVLAALFVISWRTRNQVLRNLWIVGGAILFAALASPITDPHDAWGAMASTDAGGRYFFPIAFAIAATITYFALGEDRHLRFVGYLLAPILLLGICNDFTVDPLLNLHLDQQAHALYRAKPGEHVVLAINPLGWNMDLIKH